MNTTEVRELIAELRGAVAENKAEAEQRWGHFMDVEFTEDSDYESKLTRAADALESLLVEVDRG